MGIWNNCNQVSTSLFSYDHDHCGIHLPRGSANANTLYAFCASPSPWRERPCDRLLVKTPSRLIFEYQTRTVLSCSELVATYFASGEKAKAAMAPVCPYNDIIINKKRSSIDHAIEYSLRAPLSELQCVNHKWHKHLPAYQLPIFVHYCWNPQMDNLKTINKYLWHVQWLDNLYIPFN